jgi:hypothetical protein
MLYSLTLKHVREYFQVAHVFAPFSPAPMSSNMTSTLTTLHPKSNGYFPFFLKNYKPNQDLEFCSESFKWAFQYMAHLSASGLFGMVFE